MRTSISDYEMERAATKGPEANFVDAKPKTEDHPVTKSKVVESAAKPEPKKTTARSKAK